MTNPNAHILEKISADEYRVPSRPIAGGIQYVELPLPPSMNRLWRAGDKRVYRSKEYTDWITAAGWELNLAKLKPVVGPFEIIVHVPERMVGDIDNRLKALVDILQAHGVIENDRLAAGISVFRADTTKPGRVNLAIAGSSSNARLPLIAAQ